jgi:hypothetical protein
MSTLDSIKAMHADVLDANPESAEDRERLVNELKERGNLAVKAKRWEESDCLYSKAIELGPTHALYSNRSMARLNTKKYAAAATDADECIKLDPSFAKGYYRKAQACEKLREWGPAYDAYKGCLERTKKGKEYDKMQKASEECYKKVCKQMREGKVSVDTSAIERDATTASTPPSLGPVGDSDEARQDRAKKMDNVQIIGGMALDWTTWTSPSIAAATNPHGTPNGLVPGSAVSSCSAPAATPQPINWSLCGGRSVPPQEDKTVSSLLAFRAQSSPPARKCKPYLSMQ